MKLINRGFPYIRYLRGVQLISRTSNSESKDFFDQYFSDPQNITYLIFVIFFFSTEKKSLFDQ